MFVASLCLMLPSLTCGVSGGFRGAGFYKDFCLSDAPLLLDCILTVVINNLLLLVIVFGDWLSSELMAFQFLKS